MRTPIIIQFIDALRRRTQCVLYACTKCAALWWSRINTIALDFREQAVFPCNWRWWGVRKVPTHTSLWPSGKGAFRRKFPFQMHTNIYLNISQIAIDLYYTCNGYSYYVFGAHWWMRVHVVEYANLRISASDLRQFGIQWMRTATAEQYGYWLLYFASMFRSKWSRVPRCIHRKIDGVLTRCPHTAHDKCVMHLANWKCSVTSPQCEKSKGQKRSSSPPPPTLVAYWAGIIGKIFLMNWTFDWMQ